MVSEQVDRNQTRAWGFALLTVLFWSTVATAFKLALTHLQPLELLFFAAWIATSVLLLIVIISGRWRSLRNWRLRDFLISAGLGLLNPCLYYLILFEAYDRLPAQEALPLNFAWPVVLVLLSIVLLGQKIGIAAIGALLLSFFGVFIIATGGDLLALHFDDPLGVGLALGSTVIWALYWIYSSDDKRDSVCRLLFNFVFGALALSLLKLFFGYWIWPSLPGLLAAGYVALFEMAFAFVCWLQALKLARNTAQVSGLIYLTPFLSLLVIALVLGETIRASTLLGLVLIVSGIILQKVFAARASTVKTLD